MLKRGLNNNIKTIANDFVGKHIDIEDLIIIYKTISGSEVPQNLKEELRLVLDNCDTNKDGKCTLKELISYLNKEYGTFTFEHDKGKYEMQFYVCICR